MGTIYQHHQSVVPLKSILVYPLQKNFRAILAAELTRGSLNIYNRKGTNSPS